MTDKVYDDPLSEDVCIRPPHQPAGPERVYLPDGFMRRPDKTWLAFEDKISDKDNEYVRADCLQKDNSRADLAHADAIKEIRAENTDLKRRMREAQARLDGGNDCFDSLEEVVEATVRGRGDVYGALSKLSKILKVNASWDRIVPAVESLRSNAEAGRELITEKRDGWNSECDLLLGKDIERALQLNAKAMAANELLALLEDGK